MYSEDMWESSTERRAAVLAEDRGDESLQNMQMHDPYCWQPLPRRTTKVAADTDLVATTGEGGVVCAAQRGVFQQQENLVITARKLLKWHEVHSRPESRRMCDYNEAALIQDRDAPVMQMQFEEGCCQFGRHFGRSKTTYDNVSLRTPEVRRSPDLTRECQRAEEDATQIMLKMNELSNEILQALPNNKQHAAVVEKSAGCRELLKQDAWSSTRSTNKGASRRAGKRRRLHNVRTR